MLCENLSREREEMGESVRKLGGYPDSTACALHQDGDEYADIQTVFWKQ